MNIIQEFDTIAATATPFGTGGVGIIRISGENSFNIIKKIFSKDNLEAGKIHFGKIIDDGKEIDEVIVLPFKKPKSFTGEDVIEIHCHGGINVVRNVLDTVLKNGARMAERGEFTKRAFLNKKLDLSQAEAVADLIHSKTKNFAKISLKNLSGLLGNKIKEIRQNIFELLSKIIAGIDFPEDVPEPEYEYLIKETEKIIFEINKILDCANSSNIFRQGINVAVAGKPNVGKSSLFNALLQTQRAIVTDIAGTTRDVLKETLDWGIPVTLIDTAGIREGNEINTVEKIGIEYTKNSVNEADIVLFMYDASKGMDDEDKKIYKMISSKNHIKIASKADLTKERQEGVFYLSVKSGEGLDELKEKILDKTKSYSLDDTEFITNKRQQDCLEKCRESLLNVLNAAKNHELQDLISIDLKSSLLFLDEITGEVITDDILNNIFDNFCIGK